VPSERVFDVHVHAVAGTRSQAAIVADLARLAGLGYEEALLIAAPGFGLDAEGFHGLYPDFARAGAAGGRQEFDEAVSLVGADTAIPLRVLVSTLGFLVQLQRGLVEPRDAARLAEFADVVPVAGLKNFYLDPERDDLEGIHRVSWYDPERWDPEAHTEAHDVVLDLGGRRGWPVVIHTDLRANLDAVSALVGRHPGTTVCIAHLGYSRGAITELLADHPALVTDVSGVALQEDIARRPDKYGPFLEEHAGRVMFGSDRHLYELDDIDRGLAALDALDLSDGAASALWSGTGRRLFG